jgi:PTS system nitrogen regulatory IIA component
LILRLKSNFSLNPSDIFDKLIQIEMKNTKYLDCQEVARLMDVPLVTVTRWAHQGKIPCKLKNEAYVFNRAKIISWARAHHFHISECIDNNAVNEKSPRISLVRAIEQGGVFYDLDGHDIYSVLKNAVGTTRVIKPDDRDRVLNDLIHREEIASTGIGNGIAIPHPRRPLDGLAEFPALPLFFLKKDIDFNAVDKKPVSVLFMMFSPSTPIHLKLLSALSFSLRRESFLSLLRLREEPDVLLREIARIESKFERE